MAKDEYVPFTGKLDAAPQFEPFDGTLDGAPEPGLAARLKQGASRAFDSARTALTDDPNKIAQIAAEQARTALPQTETQRKMAEEIAPYSEAASKAEGVVDNVKAWGALGFKRAGQLISNPAEAGKMIAEQLPNSLPGIAGGFAGAKAGAALGSVAGPVGTAVGGIGGAILGGFAGGYGLEKGASVQEQVQQEAQKRGIDVRDSAQVSQMLQQNYPEIEAAAQRKGIGTAGTDALLNVATMGLAGVGGRTLAKEASALAKGVKAGTISAADAATELARLEAINAARNTLAARAMRGAGVVGAEMAGEGLSEAAGQKLAYGEVNPGEVIDEALLGLGSGGVMALGSKAFNKAAGVVDQDAATRDLAAARDGLPGLGPNFTTTPGAADPNAPVPQGAAPVEAPDLQATAPAAEEAPSPIQPEAVEPAPLTPEQRMAELDERMRFIDQQAKANGWDKRLIDARDAAQAELDAIQLAPTPELDIKLGRTEVPIAGQLYAPGDTTNPLTGERIPDQRPLSQQMGIDPTAGPLSKAAATAVDSGTSQHLQDAQFLGATGRDVQLRQTGPGVTNESNVIDVDAREVPDQRGIPTARRLTNDQDGGARATSSQPLAIPAPTNLREGLERIRAQRQEAARLAQVPPTQGANLVPQAPQAVQTIAQQQEAGNQAPVGAAATTAAQPGATGGSGVQAAGLANGTPTQNDGAQAGQAQGQKNEAQGPRVILQNRDRSTPSSIAQMRSIAANPDYGRLGFSRDFANGAPVVAGGTIEPTQLGRKDVATASDGRRIPVQYAVVEAANVLPSNRVDGTPNADYGQASIPAVRAIAGNGRIAGLQAAYQGGNAATYRQELVQDAALHGIDPAVISTLQHPVLVRVMPETAVTADIGDVSNSVGNMDLSAVEQANNDANRVSLDALQFAEDGSITQEAVRQFVRAMPQAEQGGLLDTNGQPTRQAVDRLNAAVFAKAYGNDDLVRLFAQAQDPEARNVLSALAQVAPKMARLEGAGALDIRELVAQAAEIAVNARRQGVALAKAARQLDMTADPDVGVILHLFAENPRSVRPVVESLGRMADMAYTEATKPAEDMFGAVPRASRADIINQLRPENERGSQEALEDAAGRESAAVDAVGQANEPARPAALAEAQAGRAAEDGAAQDGRVNEQGAEYSVRQQFSLFGLEQSDQLQLFIDSGPVPSQAGAGAVAAQREAIQAIADMESTASILAKSLSRDYAARQRVSLVGHTVSSAADLAVLAQVYRDPRFETFRLVFTDNSGRVVSQLGISSRLPASSTVLVGDDLKSYLHEVSRAARKTGATSYYMLHNHPSGQATPSGADIELTKTFARQLPGLTMRSHVVIDTNQYSVIDANGRPQFFQQDFAQPPQALSGPLAGEVITSPADVVRMAQSLQADAGVITLIATDAQYKVKAVTSIPAATLSGGKGLIRLKIARALMRLHSANVFAISRDEAGLRKLGGIVVDALHVKDDGSVNSLASAGTIAYKPLGAFPNDRRARVSPDTTKNFAYLRFDPSKTQSAGQKLLVQETADLFGDRQERKAPQSKEQIAKAESSAKIAAEAAASKAENRKRIAQASVRAADTFELGQDPLDSLTGQEGLKFSRGPATEVRNLVTLHNLTEDNLRYADSLGGIPVPSIGITKLDSPFGGFGNITLIASKDMIDPKAGVPVYDRDAWTARFPTMNFKKVKAKMADALYERMKPVRELMAGDDGGFVSALWEQVRNASVQSPEKVIDIFTRYEAGRVLYAKEVLGKSIKIPTKAVAPKEFFAHEKPWLDFVKSADWSLANLANDNPEYIALRKEAGAAAMAAVNAYVDRKIEAAAGSSQYERETTREIYADMAAKFVEDNGAMRFGVMESARIDAGNASKKQVDRSKLFDVVQKAVKPDDPGYLRWVESLVKPLFEAPTITLRGKEVPATLDNIVDAMTVGATAGVEKSMTFSAGKAAAMLGKRFKSMDEIKAARDQVVSPQAEAEGKKSSDALLAEYRSHVSQFYTGKDWRGNIDTWAANDDAMEALAKAGKAASSDANIRAALTRMGFKGVDQQALDMARDAIDALRNAATDYFEAKPQRAVGLSEFKGAVVPKGTSPEAIAILEKHGIAVELYGKTEGAREKAIQKLAKRLDKESGGVLFSFAGARAATADTHALVTAQDRLDAGEDPETVRQETGWFKGVDGRMRFEISDADALLKADTSGAEGRRTIGQMFPLGYYGDEVGLTVGRMLHHPALFAAYPAIADIKVKMVYDLRGDDVKGSFNPSTNTITLNQNASWRDAMSTLLHEIQHGIQNIEGFAMGDSPERLAKTMPDVQAINDAKLLARFMERGESAFDARQRFTRYMGRDPNPQGVYLAERNEPNEIARMASTPLDAYKRNAGEVEARNTQARQKLTAEQRRATSPSQTADVADADVIVVFNGKEMANAPMPANAVPDASATVQPLRTQAATIRSAITKAYGKLLGQLEAKGLVTLTQTEDEAIEAAAQARAAKTGQSVEQARSTLRASVKNSVADQTQTENFQRWFKDSKVVDAEGKPLVVYHGTTSEFNTFRVGNAPGWGRGIYFTNNESVARDEYAGDDGRVVAAYVSLQNPYTGQHITEAQMEATEAGKKVLADGGNVIDASNDDGRFFGSMLRELGYDGVMLKGSNNIDGYEIVAFRPEQIKSATDNNGDFDPANPDIRRSADGSIQGFFDPQTGQSFLIADNLTAEAAPGVLMHEVGIHMVADGSMKALFNRAAMMLKLQKGNPFIKAVQARMDAAGETSGEEAAAYIAEAYENDRANAPASVQRWLADLLAAVKAWMFKKGIMGADRLTVADIAAVARANAKSMARGDVGGGVKFSRAPALDKNIPAFGDIRNPRESVSDVANSLSISTKVLGNRTVPMDSVFDSMSAGADDKARAKELASKLMQPGSFFERVILDDAGNVIEGQHRVNALMILGAKTVPAVVIKDYMRDFDEIAVGNAVRGAQKMGSDQSNQIVGMLAEIYADENGDMAEVALYEPPKGYEKAWQAGLDELSKGKSNPDIRFSRATSPTASTAASPAWDAPVQTGFDDVIYKLQDKNIDLKRVVEAITKSVGQVSDSINAYLKEELFHKRAAKRVEDFGARELKPLMNQMRLMGLGMEDVEEYLHARHAKEANAVIAQRNPGEPSLQDGGSGMTNQAADNYFAKLDPAQRRKLEAVAKNVDAIIDKTRKLYVSYGLEDQAVVDGWANMYQHYIPLMREDKDGGMGTGQGFSVKGKETKGRTGSTRKVVDILANVAMQREKLIVRGEKNIVAQALVGLAQANPNPDFWEVRSQAPTERVFDPKTGVVVDRPDPLFKSRENVVVAKTKDSKGNVTEQMVVFNEDNPRAVRMAAAMKNLDAGNLEGLLGMSAKITRYFSAINTQYNPVFGVVNLVRDVQGAMVNLGTTPLAGQQGKIAKDTLSALRGIYGDIRKTRNGGQATSQWSQLWEQMQDDGGTTGYRDLFKTSADRANDLKSILNPEGWMDSKWGKFFTADGRLKVPLSMAQKGATEIFGWLSDYNEAMENGVRLAAYKAALDKGMSREQAASLAKNLTVNFNRKGQAGMQAGAVYAFFNAAMQGTARIGQTLFDMDGGDISTLRLSKTGKAVVYGGVMLGVMQALALSAAGFDDDDPPEFVRERSLIIPTGGKTYVSIPMPLGLHVIPGIGRHATEFALSGFDKPAKRAVSMVGMFADAFNPIGNAGLSMQTIAPTALDPLVALSENKDWTGKPIARVSSNKAMPGHTQWKDTATGFSKVVAEAINWISGGNEYVAGAFSPTPDQIDYLLAQVGGGVAREAAKVQQTISTAMSGETLPTHKIPLVGRFVGNAASQASQGSAFYANLNKLNELETEIKGLRKDGRFDEAAKLARENPQSILIAMANRAERDVQRMRREKRELIANDASREQVRAKEDQITDVMTRLNEAVERRKAQAAR